MTRAGFTLAAPAKVNLCLRVLGKRADGFHEIDSVFYQVSLFDKLRFQPSANLEFSSHGLDAGPEEENLVLRAARLLRKEAGISAGASISLEKNIPSGAGLGGGSSDAACALLGLSRLWGLDISMERLQGMAETLGSDVPFFLYGPAARVGGRGEAVSVFSPCSVFHLLLVKPECSVSTAWAYQSLTLTKAARNNRLSCFGDPRFGIREAAGVLWNDFESPVFSRFPVIGEIKARLLECGSLGAVMSGSGSTVAGLFESHKKAEEAGLAFGDHWNAAVQTLLEKPGGLAGE